MFPGAGPIALGPRLCEPCSQQQRLDAALRIYARAGIGDLALNILADEAGVSNGTVYNYFRSREQVLEAVGLELAVQLSEQILTVSEALDSGAERLSIAVRTFMNKARTDPTGPAASSPWSATPKACAPRSPPTSAPTSRPEAAKATSTTPTKKWP